MHNDKAKRVWVGKPTQLEETSRMHQTQRVQDLITVGALRFPGVLRGTEIVPGVTVSRPGGLLRPEVRNLATLWD